MGNSDYQCVRCGETICFREEVLNMALGVIEPSEYLCFPCIASQFERTQEDMFRYLNNYLQRRPCFLTMWNETNSCSNCERMGQCFCPDPAA